ncbi:MAG: LysR family transcriptional regulator [Parvularculaceae bacterium]|nr:LysR family transcriptional regulator [Parvularculaceae bacterium]
MFTSTKLRQIVGIDKAGSLSAAAKTLNVSQSTLTKAVADVEVDLGMAIFIRTSRGVTATAAGREFLNRAERIVSDFDMLVEDTKLGRSLVDRSLRIAVAPAFQEGLYNQIAAQLIAKHASLQLSLEGTTLERGKRLLRRGDVDLLFAPFDELEHDAAFAAESIGMLKLRLFSRKEHPLLAVPSPSPEDMRDYQLVTSGVDNRYARDMFEKIYGEQDALVGQVHTIENFAVVAEVVASSDVVGLVSETYARSRTFKKRFALIDVDFLDPIELGAARLARWMPSRAMRACFEVMRTHSPARL